MKFIRQGATHKVTLGPAVAVGDGFTPVTTLALSSADEAEAILHDNGTVVDISGYTWAAITTADGYYHLTLQSAISNTVGHLTIVVNDDSLCLPLREDFTVVEEAIYDALFAGSANIFSGAAGSSFISGVAGTLNTLDALDTAQDSQHSTTQAAIDAVDNFVDTEIAAIISALATAQADLDTITGSDGVTLATTQGNYAPSTHSAADVWSVATRVLTANTNLNDPTAGAIADAVWDELTSGHTTAGTFGQQLKTDVDNILNYVSSYLPVIIPHLGAVGATGNDTTHIHLAFVPHADDEINGRLLVIRDDTTGEYHSRWIEDWVLSTELATVATLPFTPDTNDIYYLFNTRRDVQATDSSGNALATASALATVDGIVDDILDDTGTTLPATLSSMDGKLDAIDNYIDTEIAALTTELAKVPKSDGSVSWNATALAAIEAECEDALQLTIPDSIPADGTRPSVQQALYMITQLLTEGAISGTTWNVYKPDGTTVLFAITLDSASTPTTKTRSS